MELILNNIDIKSKFVNDKNVEEILITTDAEAVGDFDALTNHEEFEWKEVVEFGMKRIVVSPVFSEFELIDYDKITAVCIRFNNGLHDDTELIVNHKEELLNILN